MWGWKSFGSGPVDPAGHVSNETKYSLLIFRDGSGPVANVAPGETGQLKSRSGRYEAFAIGTTAPSRGQMVLVKQWGIGRSFCQGGTPS